MNVSTLLQNIEDRYDIDESTTLDTLVLRRRHVKNNGQTEILPADSMSLETLEVLLGPGNYKPIARKTGISSTHISRVLRGKVGITFKYANKIADAVGVTVDDLRRYIDTSKEL